MQIKQALQRALELQGDSPRLDVEVLLAHVLEKDRTYLFTWPEQNLNAEQVKQFNALFARRRLGEPVAHIVGHREFWSLPFKVNNSTLIPRPDTECLVEKALDLMRARRDEALRILDLGTGTGAVAIALAKELPRAQVVAVEIGMEACALANENKINLAANNVNILQSDWFENVDGVFDLVVSNPPYIDEDDEHLDEGDVRFEPKSALIAENDGLADLALIIAQAKIHMANQAWLLVEHGWDQAEKTRAIFKSNKFASIFTEKDFGNNDRITGGQFCE